MAFFSKEKRKFSMSAFPFSFCDKKHFKDALSFFSSHTQLLIISLFIL
ncbi:unknown protein [Parachlamydia acanthamoebae UV-7]|uniref:Uncharacterized protein n=2 Tax=Parachlamydia acanthamoebae TaxID=83552 RepID=F8KYB0_PARAV|nr:hypothetical protein DB43_DZ00300 [Parachlamydia acanthamoebae]CCB85845.1 unknown protein [Parachlamydia acanthamoebae UV-7]